MVVQDETPGSLTLEASEENAASVLGPQSLFTLEILKIIKDAQQQHGLRHSDYQRYRGYCTRRIRRLRKALHIPQGDKRHFKKKDVTEELLKDEKHLYIPLMMTERAWSYAMQLRQESNTEPRKKFHLVSRLRKASTYSLQLQKLCESNKCDVRTKLEAQAYVAWIHGSLHFELQLWKPAIENLKKAQMVYEKLASALPEDDQLIYKQRVDELTPSLRYCAYNIGEEGAIDDLMQMRGQGHGDLLANIDSLIVQTREKQSSVLEEVQWRGRSVQVKPERVRSFLLAEQELEKSLKRSTNNADKIELLETHLMDCKDAISAVRDEIKNDQASKNRSGPPSSLQNLLSYLTHIRLTRTVERTLLMIESAKLSLAEKNEAAGDVRKTRPQDLTRLYEIVLQNFVELQQLSGFEDDLQYQQELEGKIMAYKAFRCFYIAQSLAVMRRWPEAVALYRRAVKYIEDALSGKNACSIDTNMKAELSTLKKQIEGQEFSAHAHSILEGETQEDDVMFPGGRTAHRSKKPLWERLGEYREDPSLLTKSPNVYKLPPEMKPIPCKPLFFDLAFNFCELPDLSDKLETPAGKKGGSAGITGFVKGLWGWGSSGNK